MSDKYSRQRKDLFTVGRGMTWQYPPGQLRGVVPPRRQRWPRNAQELRWGLIFFTGLSPGLEAHSTTSRVLIWEACSHKWEPISSSIELVRFFFSFLFFFVSNVAGIG